MSDDYDDGYNRGWENGHESRDEEAESLRIEVARLLALIVEARAVMLAVVCLDAGYDDRHDQWLADTEQYHVDIPISNSEDTEPVGHELWCANDGSGKHRCTCGAARNSNAGQT